MSDIVDRLRCTALIRVQHSSDNDPIKVECLEAANEIERLRAALRAIAANTYGYEPNAMSDEEAARYFSGLFFGAQNTARRALRGDA